MVEYRFLIDKLIFVYVLESLLSYSVPQGMVRGATLELLDITYDGLEDSLTGLLTGGLGQLVDGKYGAENYRAVGENGIVRGELKASRFSPSNLLQRQATAVHCSADTSSIILRYFLLYSVLSYLPIIFDRDQIYTLHI